MRERVGPKGRGERGGVNKEGAASGAPTPPPRLKELILLSKETFA
jgi:hypothetical protein